MEEWYCVFVRLRYINILLLKSFWNNSTYITITPSVFESFVFANQRLYLTTASSYSFHFIIIKYFEAKLFLDFRNTWLSSNYFVKKLDGSSA